MKHFKLFRSLSLFVFIFNGVACSEQLDLDSEAILDMNEANIAGLTRGETPKAEYMPLNVIPDWAKQKMTDEEYAKWQQLSAYLEIDYSFLNNPNYAERRDDINKRIDFICKEISEGNDLEKYSGTFAVIYSNTTDVRNIESFSNKIETLQGSEGGPIGNDKTFRTTIFLSGDIQLIYSLIYIDIKNVGFIKYSSNLYCLPGGAHFSGSWHDRIDANHYVHVSCVGHVSYNGVYHSVNSVNNYLLD